VTALGIDVCPQSGSSVAIDDAVDERGVASVDEEATAFSASVLVLGAVAVDGAAFERHVASHIPDSTTADALVVVDVAILEVHDRA
jgi:hypothetical protein